MTGSRLVLSCQQINVLRQTIERALRLAEGYGLASAHGSDADLPGIARDLRDEIHAIDVLLDRESQGKES